MEKEKMVSIITPCYNGEDYLNRFFENILSQTYHNIELIFVNDGSSDRTEEIARSYIAKFEETGRKLIYIYQENAGQAAALNQGLKIFQGEYLMWTDADDILAETNVEKKVTFLEEHSECGFVMCRGKIVREDDLSRKIKDYYRIPPQKDDNFFEDALLSINTVFPPGVYMVRRSVILEALPTREIVVSRLGQNFQMLLPISYVAKCGYIEEELFSYVVRKVSHSKMYKTEEQELAREDEMQKLLSEILHTMQIPDLEHRLKQIHGKNIRNKFDIGYRYKDKKLMRIQYQKMKEQKIVKMRDKLIYLASMSKVVEMCYNVYKKRKKTI